MLSKKKIICPENLLKIAKTKGPVKAVIVNAGKAVSIESTKQAVDEDLINPVFVGDKNIIEKLAGDIKWDISKYEIIDEPIESCDRELSININTKKQLIYGQGIPYFITDSEKGYIYREENNLIITNIDNQWPDGRQQRIGISLNRKNGKMKIRVEEDSLIKDEIRGDYRAFFWHTYKFNCQISDSKKLF